MKKWEGALKNPRPQWHLQWLVPRSFGRDQWGVTQSTVTPWSVLRFNLFFFFLASTSQQCWQQIQGNQEPISADNERLQHPPALEDSGPDTLAAFPVVCICFTSFPQWQWSCSDSGWAPIPSSQCVGGSSLAKGKLLPSPSSPLSQPSWAQAHSSGVDHSGDLVYSGKITKYKKWEGAWPKGWGPAELDLRFIGNYVLIRKTQQL